MHPVQPIAPEVPRHAAPHLPLPGRTRPPASRPHAASGAYSALASFVTYAKALETLDRNRFPEEYAEHADRLRELRPLLRAHGILDVMKIKNPEVAALIGG
ncbi:hypothetical protein [Nocardia spumae]|uniref:hypothetical protein n=1 Tax=Nocardia spumae TaxID=2887190 RepID=UPI001D143DA3|nr:hypothetical protein [Nocardia spumae]